MLAQGPRPACCECETNSEAKRKLMSAASVGGLAQIVSLLLVAQEVRQSNRIANADIRLQLASHGQQLHQERATINGVSRFQGVKRGRSV